MPSGTARHQITSISNNQSVGTWESPRELQIRPVRVFSGLVSGLRPSLERLNRASQTRKVVWLKSSISSEMYLWLVVSNVFLIPRTDVIVVLPGECGRVLCGVSLCCITIHHWKAGRNELYLNTEHSWMWSHKKQCMEFRLFFHKSK